MSESEISFRLRQGKAKLQTKLSPKLSIVEVARLALRYWKDPDLATVAVAVAGAESGFKVRAMNAARNGTSDYGLFQINEIHQPEMRLIYDADYNTNMAYRIWWQRQAWGKQGFDAWVAFKAGKHLEFMPYAAEAVREALS